MIGALVVIAFFFGRPAYYKSQIEGNWSCQRGDGVIEGGFSFGDAGDYLYTKNRYEQYYGDYSVNGSKLISTTLVGSMTGASQLSEENPLEMKFAFVSREKNHLILQMFAPSRTVALSCEPL